MADWAEITLGVKTWKIAAAWWTPLPARYHFSSTWTCCCPLVAVTVPVGRFWPSLVHW